MKNKITTIFFAAFFSCLLLASTSSAQQSPCAELANKTYVAFGETIFDQPMNARELKGAYAFRVKFNADGTKGDVRILTEPANAYSQQSTFDCLPNFNGRNQFKVTGSNGSDEGYFVFKSFDKGSEVRMKSWLVERGTPFWMVQLPAEPNPEPLPNTKN